MSQGLGFEDPKNPTQVCRLHKAIYGPSSKSLV